VAVNSTHQSRLSFKETRSVIRKAAGSIGIKRIWKNWDSVDVTGNHPVDAMGANVGVANVSSQRWCDCKWSESDRGYIVWIRQEMPLV
jgi:hypothetical protein